MLVTTAPLFSPSVNGWNEDEDEDDEGKEDEGKEDDEEEDDDDPGRTNSPPRLVPPPLWR